MATLEAAIQGKKRNAAIVALDGRVTPGHDLTGVVLPWIASRLRDQA